VRMDSFIQRRPKWAPFLLRVLSQPDACVSAVYQGTALAVPNFALKGPRLQPCRNWQLTDSKDYPRNLLILKILRKLLR
jgi:hypothetical protein